MWLSNAVPYAKGKPSNCYRYPNSTILNHTINDTCDISFDDTKQIQCNEYVYQTDEISILNDVSCEVRKSKPLVHSKK